MLWNEKPLPVFAKPKGLQWVRVILRIIGLAFGTFLVITTYILFIGIEKIIPKIHLRPAIVSKWGTIGLRMTGLKVEIIGKHMRHGGAVVANHASWIDIFTLHDAARVSFVAKAEVRRWPVLGWLADVTGTLFIERRASQAKNHQAALLKRLEAGDQLCFFPEGTSTDGLRVVPFRSTLFSVFHTPELIDHVWVQPATICYLPQKGLPQDFYGWWGEMALRPHAFAVLACSTKGRVRVTLHDPVKASDFATRKDLARYCEDIVREGLAKDLAT